MAIAEFKVDWIDIERVRPYWRVAPRCGNRLLQDWAVDTAAKWLAEDGWRQPLVVDDGFTIIVGHTRWRAAKKLGMSRVPVHVAKGLSPIKTRTYRIADDQVSVVSQWDYEVLRIELDELDAAGVDLHAMGFDETRLADLVARPLPAAAST